MKAIQIFLVGLISFASQAESLKSFLASHPKKDSLWVKSLLDFGISYEKEKPDSALIIYRLVIEASGEIRYWTGQAKGYQFSGIVHSDQGDYSEAILDYQKAVEFYKKINNTRGESGCYTNLGNVYFLRGIFKESLNYYLKALVLVEANYDSAKMPSIYTNLGSLYSSIRDYEKSIGFNLKSLNIAEAKNDSTGMMISCINLGVTLVNYERLDSASKYYLRALKLAELLDDSERQYTSLNNLADIAKSKGHPDEAINFSLQALTCATKTGKPYVIASAKLVTGNYLVNAKNYQLGIRYLKEGLKISIDHKVLENMARGYDWLSQAEEKVGLLKEALADYRLSTFYYDSLTSESSFKEIGSIEGKYELEKQIREKRLEEDRMAAQEQPQRNRRDRIQYFVIVLVLAVLFMVIKLVGNLNMSEKASHLITLIVVMLFFEFLLVIMDPYVESLSGNVPVYKLLINLLLALSIFPIHEWLLKILSSKKLVNVEG